MEGTIRFWDSDEEHIPGDENCKADWCGNQGYPLRCKCGSLIHADYGDFNPGGPQFRRCDRCGNHYEEAQE